MRKDATPVFSEIPRFGTCHVMVHDRRAVISLGRERKGDIISSRGDGARTAGDEHGNEGLFEVVVSARGGDEFAAEKFDATPIDRFRAEAREADVNEVGHGSPG